MKKRLYNLDPRCKLLMMATISTVAMLTRDVFFMGALVLITLGTLLFGGASMKNVFHRSRALIGMILVLFVIQLFFRRDGEALLLIGDLVLFYTEGLHLAILLTLRLFLLLFAAQILLEGETRDYLLALVQIKTPYEIAFMVMTALHLIPIIKEEALNVYYSIQLRGVDIKISTYFKISLPILVSSMRRANDMSIAMEARGLRAYPKRTYMRKLHLTKSDIIMMIIYPLSIIAIFILWRVFI